MMEDSIECRYLVDFQFTFCELSTFHIDMSAEKWAGSGFPNLLGALHLTLPHISGAVLLAGVRAPEHVPT